MRKLILCIGLFVLGMQQALASVSISNVRLWDAPDHSRLVFELSNQVEHQVMMLPNPDRLVLDLKDTARKTTFDELDLTRSPIKRIRSARRNNSDLRVVLDLKERVQPKSFLLKPNEQYGNRLVIDLYPKSGTV